MLGKMGEKKENQAHCFAKRRALSNPAVSMNKHIPNKNGTYVKVGLIDWVLVP